MTTSQQPLSTLAQEPSDVTVIKTDNKSNLFGTNTFLNLLLWFIIIAVVIWLILYALKPTFVLKTTNEGGTNVVTNEIDQTKAIGISIVVSLIIVIIIYILRTPRV